MHICISLCIHRTRIAETKLMLQVTSAAAHREARTHGRFCGTSISSSSSSSSSSFVYFFLLSLSPPFVHGSFR